jgi:predicted AAA+ superfamily ATPase
MTTITTILSFAMRNLEEIRTLLIEQRESFLKQELGVERTKLAEIARYKDTPYSVIISGLRRAGKSTLLAQIAKNYYPDVKYFFVNFEDDRFISFTTADFAKLHELFIELFGNHKIFFLDEVQTIEGWEIFVNRMMRDGYKFYITGANASLLSKELSTKLTGRHLPVELLPFSFDEYLTLQAVSPVDMTRLTTVQRGELKKAFTEYVEKGGIPQAIQYPELPILKTLYDDILQKDIVIRYKLTDIKPLKELSFYLLNNITSLVSFNKLKDLLQFGSANTVSSYVGYLETSWLFFVVNKYAFSVKEQQIANKKIYCVDTGLVKSVAFSFSENKGKFLENIVFINLWRKYKEVYYYKTQKENEVDFYIPKERLFVQVAQTLVDPATRERELRALTEALKEVEGSKGLILTDNEKEIISLDNKTISVLPIYDWILSGK